MGVRDSSRRLGSLVIAMLAVVALGSALVANAGGASVVKNGHVYACYKVKGKGKGTVRLVPKKGKCHKGEKKISWGVTGPTGEAGSGGENGSNGTNGEGGSGGEKGSSGTGTGTSTSTQSLEKQVLSLTSKLSSLESVLKGVTNSDLTGMLSKLQGISPTELQAAVASVAKVNELCSQTGKLTSQSNALGAAVGGLELPALPLDNIIPSSTAPIPAPLSTFSCP